MGRFRGTVRMPDAAGNYRLVVQADGQSGIADLAVVDTAARAQRASVDTLAAWAASQGGEVILQDQLETLTDRLNSAVMPQSMTSQVHPMRSAWWIVPFSLLLGGEWWFRRRRGER